MEWLKFHPLDRMDLVHGFSQRSEVPLSSLNEHLAESVSSLGIHSLQMIQAQQTHGKGVAVVKEPRHDLVPEVDALVTSVVGLALIVRVADCGPLFFYDPVQRVIAVAHSGRKGTELNIARETIQVMKEKKGCRAEDLLVVLGPCIRPPHYEIAFAQEIGIQVRAEGVQNYQDCGLCTGSDLGRFYSYRMEKGKTGRMWGVLMMK